MADIQLPTDAAPTLTNTKHDASILSPAASSAEDSTSATIAVPKMELSNCPFIPGEAPADNVEDGHPGGRVEDQTQGAGYATRGGHQNTKQGRKERKKGKKEMGRTAYR